MSDTSWVEPASSPSGQDHLGAIAVSESIYGQLLPGLTNLTQRIRYYSFYPWLLWALEAGGHALDEESVTADLRKSECLLTLVALRHEKTGAPGQDHGAFMIGSRALAGGLRELEEGQRIRLADFADRSEDNPKRYFKNKRGGLGQYYFGALLDLDVLGRAKKLPLGYTPGPGRSLAAAYDTFVDRAAFLRVLELDHITLGDLDSLTRFCPCQVAQSDPERGLLVELLFAETQPWAARPPDVTRRRTLTVLLDLADHLGREPVVRELTVDLFRRAVYSCALPSGAPWHLPEELELHRQKWSVYQRHELVSLSAQAFLWAAVYALAEEPGAQASSAESFGDWFATHFEGEVRGANDGNTFAARVGAARSELPDLSDVGHERHELELGALIGKISHGSGLTARDRATVVRAAIDVLVALAARQLDPVPYRDLAFPRDHLKFHPINLASFQELATGEWRDLSTHDLLAWIGRQWCLETHVRIAMRKLRQSRYETFCLRPTETGFAAIPKETLRPTYGSPRIGAAIQALRDLGLVTSDPQVGTNLTAEGASLHGRYLI